MTRHTLLALTLVIVLGMRGTVPDGHSASRGDAPTLARTVVLDGLDDPWDLAFTPDGALLVTEKCHGLSVRRVDGSRHHLFGRAGAEVTASDFFCKGQSGAHGIAVDPEFARTRFVYLYMPSALASPPTNCVVRLVVDPSYTRVSARTDIVPDIPFKHAANAVGGAGLHSGGRLRFGPDGFLYITTGDNHQPTLPQDLTRLGGKKCCGWTATACRPQAITRRGRVSDMYFSPRYAMRMPSSERDHHSRHFHALSLLL